MYIFEATTVQSGPFRTLIESLKDSLDDVRWDITPTSDKKDKNGKIDE
ncbi:MAG: hypothetical protein Faunusvirus52_1, partial [Faunusvirus sp.]